MNKLLSMALSAAALLGGCTDVTHVGPAPLAIERAIPLANTEGRIDHLAIDLGLHRLFVAEIANGSIDVIDLTRGVVLKQLNGLKEPQGLVYLPQQNLLVVACGGEGAVRFYDASRFTLLKTIGSLDDADNVRLDPVTGNVVVGYGGGGLAVIDPAKQALIETIPLPSHPEGFQIDPASHRAFVNLPGALKIAVVDLTSGKVSGGWGATQAIENFPMALDATDHVIASGFRVPGRFMAYDPTGKVMANLPACNKTDDLFFDALRHRFYMLCGDGHIDVFGGAPGALRDDGAVATKEGGRTGLWSSDEDRLYVTVSASGDRPAQVLVLSPK